MSHYQEHTTIIAGIAVVRNGDDKYLFMRRSAHESYGTGKWDFPGGAKDFLETPEEGTLRECKEESGLDVTINRLLWYRVNQGVFDTDTEFCAFFFLCTPKEDQEIHLSEEHDAYKWLTLEEVTSLDTVEWMDSFIEHVQNGTIDLS